MRIRNPPEILTPNDADKEDKTMQTALL